MNTPAMRVSRLLCAGIAVAALLACAFSSPALAAPEQFRFLAGPEAFDGSLPVGEPLSSSGVFSFPFFDAEDPGPPATQAGSHPYALTVGFASENELHELAQFPKGMTAEYFEEEEPFVIEGAPTSALRDATVNLPRGVIVDPDAVSIRCTSAEFAETTPSREKEGRGCPISSVVGVATLYIYLAEELIETRDPIFNMVPPAGTPAELGFDDAGAGLDVVLEGRVRTGGDYGLSAEAREVISKLPILGASVTLWGDPTDPSHDGERGYCASPRGHREVEEGGRTCPVPATHTALLTMPSVCSGPLKTTIAADSWQQPGAFSEDSFETHGQHGEPVGVEGCSALAFTPSINVEPYEPQAASADSPTGLHIDLHVPQSDGYGALAEANLKNAVVTLPEGMVVNPSAADGLAACSSAQSDLNGPGPAECPDASKIGTVEVDTPLLEHPLPGAVYLAKQGENPFGSLLALYIAVDDPISGVVIKLAGHVEANPVTGRLTTTFDENPELPFEDFKLDFFGGPRAPLTTPPACGMYTTETSLTPWSGTPAVMLSSRFNVASGCATGGFAPSFSAGTAYNQAGGYSPFSLTFSRQDGEQRLGSLQVTMPPGLLGRIAGIPQCPEPQAGRGECGEGSLLGEATTAVGAGPAPYWVKGGKVYLTGPYNGGPFGLSIVVPTTAGPFTLTGNGGPGREIVRASIRVNPNTAQITVVSDPLPTILEGIPLDIRTVNVTVNRSGFMFNPTNCESLSLSGTITSTAAASAGVSSPFEAANCAALPFKPSFTASTQGKTSKANGASLVVKVAQKSGEANIRKVDLQLPIALPSRLTTLQKACTEAQFNANPAGCPEGSFIGTAKAVTPVLNVPLVGPAILVSHGGAAFPDVEFVLQGEGVEIVLDGKTDIKKGITYSEFETVPDAPISSFETVLPEGPHSVLAAYGSLCSQNLVMPTTITGQNGAQVTQSTNITATGCGTPSIKITKAKVKGNTVLVTVTTSQPGTVTVSGSGLKTTRETFGAGGAHQLKVSLTKNGRTARAHHRKTKVKASVTDSNGSSSKTTTLKL